MTLEAERVGDFLERLANGLVPDVFAEALGEHPTRIFVDRVHFPRKRPINLEVRAICRLRGTVSLFVEVCPETAGSHSEGVLTLLSVDRLGQAAGLDQGAIVADEETGIVIRKPGLDDRLPGLRVLYNQDFAKIITEELTGTECGLVTTELVSHRLGKRAVIKISTSNGVYFARVRPVKNSDGAAQFLRHRQLWQKLLDGSDLRLPAPIGLDPEFGVSIYSQLLGRIPDFNRNVTMARVTSGIAALQHVDGLELPPHDGKAEANILLDWQQRCRRQEMGFTNAMEAAVYETAERLRKSQSELLPCHRDLHEKQILENGGSIGLLDFDTLSLGPRALDPGNFLAHLFLAGVPERGFQDVPAPELRLWRRASLLRLSMIYSFTSMPASSKARLCQEALSDDRH